jgi:hypothetical protein
MLVGLVFRVLREPFKKAFLDLPPLPAPEPLPADINGARYTLMRALQGMRAATLQQFGVSEPFEYYAIGYSALHPVMAKALITHGWVTAARPHWAEAVVQYRLSPAGLALKIELEAWWEDMTLGQRLRAALLE